MGELTACTIVSANYLPYARILAASFAAHHPGGRFVVLLVDRVDGRFEPEAEPFEVIPVEQLPTLEEPLSYLFKYTVLEANTAVKPQLLEHLLGDGAERVVYLDPDILLFRPLEAVVRLLDDHDIVLTPHLTAPIDDDRHPDELAIMRSGTYNLGFIAVAAGATTGRFLAWWRDRIFDRCVSRVEQGLFTDQKWIDLVPGMFPGVAILRNPGYNVAYWNLHERRVRLGNPIAVNGRPLVFFHFSGIDPDHLEAVSKHQNRFRLADIGDAAALFRDYARLLENNGYRETISWPYAYAQFDDGTSIPEVARDLYRTMGPDRGRFGNPFAVDDGFKEWLNRPSGLASRRLTRLLHHLWSTQGHFQRAFPDPGGRDLEGYVEWLEREGRAAYGLTDEFLAPARARRDGRARPLAKLRERLRHAFWTAWGSYPARSVRDWVRRRIGERRWMAMKLRIRGPAAVAAPPIDGGTGPTSASLGGLRPGVDVLGYLKTESGVGESARCLVRALEAAGARLRLEDLDLGVASRRDDSSLDLDRGGDPLAINLLVVNADQVDVMVDHLGAGRFAGHVNVGFWAWEMDRFPDEWLPAFRHFDELWTHSRFCVDVFSSASPVPVRRVPLPVEVPTGLVADRGEFGIAEDELVVLTVFDLLSYFERKNPLALVEAFRRSLGDRDDALLIVKTANSYFAPERFAELEAACRGLRVRILDRTLPRAAIWRLMACCDVYASLHRAEGYGLTLLEAMALGKPVLATGYSGNADFMNPSNSLPVGYRLVPVARPAGPYRPGMVWAEPDVDHAAELLRRIAGDRGWAERIGEAARTEVAERLTPRALAGVFRERVSALLQRAAAAGNSPS